MIQSAQGHVVDPQAKCCKVKTAGAVSQTCLSIAEVAGEAGSYVGNDSDSTGMKT